MLERNSHPGGSSFATLTYSDEFLPQDQNLKPDDLTKFLKRLRYNISPTKIRYFAVGEYGEHTWRPHYHLDLFGLSVTESDKVNISWGMGFTSLYDLNLQTAKYISGYCAKGLTGKNHPRLQGRHPEFMRSSRLEGGIGLPTIKRLAERLRACENLSQSPVTSLRRGKTRVALGRYLTSKFQEISGIPKEAYEEKLGEYQKNLFELAKENPCYYDAVIELDGLRTRNEIHNLENRPRRRPL